MGIIKVYRQLRAVDKLAEQIHDSGERFAAAVGVLKGGAVPARLLVARLAIAKMHDVNVEKRGDDRVVTTAIHEDLAGKRVLLVEDGLETGRSMQEARDYLEWEKGAVVMTAALYVMHASEVMPDFYLRKVTKIPHFFWEESVPHLKRPAI